MCTHAGYVDQERLLEVLQWLRVVIPTVTFCTEPENRVVSISLEALAAAQPRVSPTGSESIVLRQLPRKDSDHIRDGIL